MEKIHNGMLNAQVLKHCRIVHKYQFVEPPHTVVASLVAMSNMGLTREPK
jgi:hypothetical protein